MDKTKILFLDMDGVLNSIQSHVYFQKQSNVSYPEGALCPIAISNLQYILSVLPELNIVVSSTWRMRGLGYMREVLQRYGVSQDRIIGITPRLDDVRGKEIHSWLENNRRYFNVGMFVILDDDDDMDPLKEYLVQTNPENGLMWHDVQKVIKMLMGELK